MNTAMQTELKSALKSNAPLEEIVALLRQYKAQGVTQAEAYSFLEGLLQAATDEAVDDRIREVADFVAGFCAPHMKIWEDTTATKAV